MAGVDGGLDGGCVVVFAVSGGSEVCDGDGGRMAMRLDDGEEDEEEQESDDC